MTPVMYTDGSGTSPSSIWKGIGALVLGTVIVGAIVIFSAGLATPILVGAGIGALTGGGVSIAMQLATGDHTIDWGKVLVDTAVGRVMGAFGGTALGRLGMTIAGAGVGFGSSIVSDIVAGEAINWGAAFGSAALGGLISFVGGAGAQNNKLAGITKFTNRMNVIKDKGITGKYVTNTVKYLKREQVALTKLALTTIYKQIPYGIGTSVLDFFV